MKIIKCSIENYGTLNKYEYNFNDGLNIINEENGFGKSTLASFIKAMFYGLPNSGSKSIKSSERKKYLPWNGGKFGGSLDFSYKEKEYRIERFFGSTASQDKFKLIDLKTNLKSNDFTEKIGEEIFLLDVSSFEKSSFFPQNDLLFSGISDDIQKKLTSTIEQSKDSSGYLEAKAILEKQKRDFYTNKNKGLIVENDSEIERLKRDIDRLKNLSLEASNKKDFIKNKNIDLNNLEKKHFEVKNQISESSKNIINKVTKDKYLELVNTQDNYLQEIKRIENLGLVNNEDLIKIEKAVEEQKVLKNSCDILNVELKKLDSVQNVNINDISETTENIKDLEKCIYKKQALEENYYISFVNEEEIKNIEENINIISKGVSKFNNFVYSLIGLFVLFTLLIIMTDINILKILFGVLSGISLCIFIIVFLLFNKKINKEKKDIEKSKEYLDILFNKKGLVNSDYNDCLNQIKNNNILYLNKNNEISNLNININELQNKIDSVKKIYGLNNLTNTDFIDELKKRKIVYEGILQQRKEIEEKINASVNKYQEISSFLENEYSKYKVEKSYFESPLDILKTRNNKYKELKRELVNIINNLDNFVEENNITEDFLEKDYFDIDVEKLNKEEKDLYKEISDLKELIIKTNEEIKVIDIECDKISLLEEDLDSRISLKAEYQKEFSVLEKTLELLKEAKDNLSSNYLNPMIASLNKYLKEIDKEFSNINLDINLDPMFTESGELKEISYLSAGYQDLVSICIRLALVENIYKNEKPLLILDDPFVNLDSEKLEKAKRLLNSISNDYQVLYMVCHDSRV